MSKNEYVNDALGSNEIEGHQTPEMSGGHDLVPQDLYEGPCKIGSKNFVYDAIKKGEIPSYRIGAKLFIHRDWREQIKAAQGAP